MNLAKVGLFVNQKTEHDSTAQCECLVCSEPPIYDVRYVILTMCRKAYNGGELGTELWRVGHRSPRVEKQQNMPLDLTCRVVRIVSSALLRTQSGSMAPGWAGVDVALGNAKLVASPIKEPCTMFFKKCVEGRCVGARCVALGRIVVIAAQQAARSLELGPPQLQLPLRLPVAMACVEVDERD